jgi:oxygen-independent coproporphyrinogen-3 oxidase
MYKTAVEILTYNGFEHYEVSNYALPGKRSKHNQKYWKNNFVWGFGMGAASFVNNKRYTRPNNMKEYIQWVNDLENNVNNIYSNSNNNSNSDSDNNNNDNLVDSLLELIMLSLRTSDGLDLEFVKNHFGLDYKNKIIISLLSHQFDYNMNRTVLFFDEYNNTPIYLKHYNNDINITHVRLSDPYGFLISNEIISSIFADIN